jgi:hypothetical protein
MAVPPERAGGRVSDLHELPNVPMTLEEAAQPLFKVDYKTLRSRLKTLMAEGLPVVKDGKQYLLYPAHVEAWRISRYPDATRRALRQGGYSCSDAARSGITETP